VPRHEIHPGFQQDSSLVTLTPLPVSLVPGSGYAGMAAHLQGHHHQFQPVVTMTNPLV